MRSATRVLLSLSAALALLVSTIGTAAAAPVATRGAALVNAEVMGTFHGEYAKHQKPGGHGRNNNLSSGGGLVETTPAVYIVYWGSEWGTGFTTGGYTSAQAQTYNEGFFSNVGGSSWNKVVTQYCQGVSAGTQTCPSSAQFITNPAGQLKDTWGDTASVPNHPTQSQIAAEAVKAVGHFGYDANATYLVYTPSGKSMNGFGTQWCAWHSSTTSGNDTIAYGYIPYMPDAGASCGMNFVNQNGYFDGFSIVAGHEYSEAETDPHPSSGWVDARGAENADKCAWSSASGNITLGGKQYPVQPTWSNAVSGCAMSA